VLKSPEQAAARALVADPAVAMILGQRIWPVIAPASASLPFATWRRTGVSRSQGLSGPTGATSVQLAVDVFSTTYEEARAAADRIRSVLDGWGGQVTDYVSVRNVSLETESDGFVQLAGGDLPPVYQVTQSFSILWQET
jgi:hypothetical protein